VGIAASGNTPYVHGGLLEARERGAGAWLLCCNPRVQAPDFEVIALDTGAEALTGSTRLKAGSATKMALNILTTGAMARAGYIYEGYMVRVRPLNRKLAGRCARIIAALTGCDEARGATLLEAAHGDIPVAVLMERLGLDEPAARARLDDADWDLRAILE
jgi:N-acetylmuramic acid 6-phosphate etherase